MVLALFVIGCQRAVTEEKKTAEAANEEQGNLFEPKEEAKEEVKLEDMPDKNIVNSTSDFDAIEERLDFLE